MLGFASAGFVWGVLTLGPRTGSRTVRVTARQLTEEPVRSAARLARLLS